MACQLDVLLTELVLAFVCASSRFSHGPVDEIIHSVILHPPHEKRRKDGGGGGRKGGGGREEEGTRRRGRRKHNSAC